MGDVDSPSYSKTPRNTVNRYKPRAKYDFETIHNIINTSPILHVSFATPDSSDPFPALLPMLGFMGSYSSPDAPLSESLDLYLHGYVSSRLMRMGKTATGEEEGMPMTISATLFDGVVLALTPNNHSYNYRSVVMQGYAKVVEDVDEKLWAMERTTNSVVEGRWEHTRVPPNKTEMTTTQILRITPISASAKIRSGPPHDDRHDLKDEKLREKTWIGVLPASIQYGVPIASPDNRAGDVKSHDHITSFVKEKNKIGEEGSKAAASE
ncbi:hypothetical protein ACMFMG_010357 [Clarireedia jacksonii]